MADDNIRDSNLLSSECSRPLIEVLLAVTSLERRIYRSRIGAFIKINQIKNIKETRSIEPVGL
jgi:hypothetical protein